MHIGSITGQKEAAINSMTESFTFNLDPQEFFLKSLAYLKSDRNVILKTQDAATDAISPDSEDLFANRQLLSISSSYFKNLLSGVNMDVNEVVIKGVSHEILSKVVDVTHGAATEFKDKQEAKDFMEIANRYECYKWIHFQTS